MASWGSELRWQRRPFYESAACIGGNKILLQADGASLFLDFGLNFGAGGRFSKSS